MEITSLSQFKGWRDILAFAKERGLKNLARRLNLNNEMWESSGEFGRDQVAVCDAIRFADTIEEAEDIAKEIDEASVSYMEF